MLFPPVSILSGFSGLYPLNSRAACQYPSYSWFSYRYLLHIHDFSTCFHLFMIQIFLPVSTYSRFSYLYLLHIHDFPTCINYIFTIFLPVSTTYFLHCNKYLSYMNSVHDKKLNETKSRRRKENIALHNFKQGVLLHLTWCAHYTEGSEQMGDILSYNGRQEKSLPMWTLYILQ